jgi:hypothetical protein
MGATDSPEMSVIATNVRWVTPQKREYIVSFMFIQLFWKGRAGEVWKFYNKATLFLVSRASWLLVHPILLLAMTSDRENCFRQKLCVCLSIHWKSGFVCAKLWHNGRKEECRKTCKSQTTWMHGRNENHSEERRMTWHDMKQNRNLRQVITDLSINLKENCEKRDNYRHQDCWRTLHFLNYKAMLETFKCFDPKLNAPFHLRQGPTEISKWLKSTITYNDTSQ